MEFFKRRKKISTEIDESVDEVNYENVMEEPEVTIGEKLAFWKEQDTLNKEMIPRIIKNHEDLGLMKSEVDDVKEKVMQLQSEREQEKRERENAIKVMYDNQERIEKLQKVNKVLIVIIVVMIISRFIII